MTTALCRSSEGQTRGAGIVAASAGIRMMMTIFMMMTGKRIMVIPMMRTVTNTMISMTILKAWTII